MTCVLAIDPGSAGRGCACAAYVDDRLVEVWFEHFGTRATPDSIERIDTIVVEKPVPQGGRTLSARYEDLANLAWDGALLAGAYHGHYHAHDLKAWPATDWNGQRGWKGTECKPHNHKRLWAVLDDAERRVLGGYATEAAIEAACEKWARKRGGIEGARCYSSDVHNLLDAAALGACFVGRMKRA